ncbi:unnamed protein product [Medioppia subpectinata]|uniref:Uncharacterized protein n=1 Tax=Medioppia subpectinata TaxID=1979941 RepID=A0A7R9KJD7_9ACAR|nr:unnamed protein product [Medioppia subpectinata]CAG2103463.1 unnamed protein product [Medioppia subpectinata]
MTQQMKHKKTSLETTDDGNEDNKQQSHIYAKDYLDRFGDDLCALLVSYLSLEDRFQCECVSKQFQRTVFVSVVDITLSDGLIHRLLKEKRSDIQMLATFAIKCPNIQTIDCREVTTEYVKRVPEVLNTLRQYCRHLRHIYCNFWKNCDQIVQQFGPLVTTISNMSSKGKQWIINCPKLSQLDTNSLSRLYDNTSGQILAKNLHKFWLFCGHNESNQQLSAFVTHNQTLKSLLISVYYDNNEDLSEMLTQLSRLTQLRDLTLGLYLLNGENSLSKSLRTIGLNCKQLQRLSLSVESEAIKLNPQTLDSLRCYHSLKRLHLTLVGENTQQLWEPLKLCHRLTHLTLNQSDKEFLYGNDIKPDLKLLSDKLLVNCDKHWPRLQYLSIISDEITGECLSHLSRLPALQMLVIKSRKTNDLSDNDLNAVLSSSPKLKTIEIRVNRAYQLKLNVQTLDSLRYYSRLKRLDLTLNSDINQEVLEPLKLCHRLTHLTLNIWQMSDKSLDNCDKQWPRLHYLSIKAIIITRECLSHISRLPALQMLGIQLCFKYPLNKYDFNDMLSSSPKLKTIEIRVNNEKKFYSK